MRALCDHPELIVDFRDFQLSSSVPLPLYQNLQKIAIQPSLRDQQFRCFPHFDSDHHYCTARSISATSQPLSPTGILPASRHRLSLASSLASVQGHSPHDHSPTFTLLLAAPRCGVVSNLIPINSSLLLSLPFRELHPGVQPLGNPESHSSPLIPVPIFFFFQKIYTMLAA
ncbi:hypothetical protein K470DRAFT_16138 [Piedraia hortae CBS 480.64]|uniref:Uncharacterized protein n=1 Tax=Piedraia hortae CBS 480.64 TaxID=1314780 RepID=A0A6A7C5E8_9PEZI|nr:hypothetical protein K470DRAFT_16138 [Piedraia hortae CBS 480.64]